MDELETKKIIALMSGTSCDSIDVGFCEVKPDLSCKLIDGINFKYPDHVREKLFDIFQFSEQKSTIKDICQMNFVVGKCFADAANELIKKWGKPDFISSHGQTIFHYPFDDTLDGISLKSTLQIGESSIIAQETGCMTISNFREADIAQGGQGAPLVCFADEKWFKGVSRSESASDCDQQSEQDELNDGDVRVCVSKLHRSTKGKNIAIQNIGGISNVTVISPNCSTFGFDTGVGNIMMDYCCDKFFGMPYDKDGKLAAQGVVSESWLNCLLEDEYYFKIPPKTTGREYFSPIYIENALKIAKNFELDDERDIVATLTALTAKSIAQAYERYVYPNVELDEVIIGGGGAYNPALMKLLRLYLPKHIELKTHEDYDISNNFKEVMAFALLGYCTFYGIPNNLPSCTGAKKRVVMGKITTA